MQIVASTLFITLCSNLIMQFSIFVPLKHKIGYFLLSGFSKIHMKLEKLEQILRKKTY